MAQDEIIIKYRVDASEFGKVGAAVNTVTGEVAELKAQVQSTFSDKAIDEATQKLYEQGDVMGALITRYGNAQSALKAMQKELGTMAALGQRGTKEFKELAKATAELQDTIGDTRGEIKKMASDTRVFDTMVQGMRGVTAAFSVGTGLAAAFGNENENLQKALLKVQGAMAALQGVQELANIATEKGGIATKAYGVALQVVEKISKVTGLSMAASWAMATAGITVVIAGVVSLIYYLKQADDQSEENFEKEQERQKLLEKTASEGQTKALKTYMEVSKEFDRQQEIQRKQAILRNEDANLTELRLQKEKIARESDALRDFNLLKVFLSKEDAVQYKKYLEDRLLEAQVAAKKLNDTIFRPKQTPIEPITPITTVGPLIRDESVKINKMNAEQMNRDLKEFAYNKSIEAQKEYNRESENLQKQMVDSFASLNQNMFSFVSGVYQNQLSELDAARESELVSAGDNAEKRKKIEQKFAVEQAKIRRQQAIFEKAAAITAIAIDLAKAIQTITAEAAKLASNPATAALAGNAYGQLGIAIATAAFQTATVSSKPLPAIPTFEKGGAVALAGGRIFDNLILGRSHREGGVLINAQGGEYIWDIPTVRKHGDLIKAAHENRIEDLVMHKYVVPALQAKQNQSVKFEAYDDMLLRHTIKQSNKELSKDIIRGISRTVADAAYLKSRYAA